MRDWFEHLVAAVVWVIAGVAIIATLLYLAGVRF